MRHVIILIKLCVILLLMVASNSIFFAQAALEKELTQYASWQSLGPDGGRIRTFIQDPFNSNILYAAPWGNPCRIHRTVDKGNSWTEISLIDEYVGCFAIDPNMPSVLYAGGRYSVYKSVDSGRTWHKYTISGAFDIHDMTVDPDHSNIIHACITTEEYSDYFCSYFRSVDGGQTWSKLRVMPPNSFGSCMAVDPTNSNVIYIGGHDYPLIQVFKSVDGGSSFSNITSTIKGTRIYDMIIDPSSPNKIYVATDYGIYRSADYGSSWALTEGIAYGCKLSLHPQDTNILYAGHTDGIYTSRNGGVNWNYFSNGLYGGECSGIHVDGDSPNIIYYSSKGGFFKSVNSGTDWNPSNSGMRIAIVKDLKLTPSSTTTIYIACQADALYKTANASSEDIPDMVPTWVRLPEFAACDFICALMVHPQNANVVYALEGRG